MKKLIAVAAAVLVLAGCSAPQDEMDNQRSAPESSASPTVTAAPIEEQPETETVETAEPMPGGDEEFLNAIYPAWHGTLPADSELLAAGNYACEQMRAGVAEDDIVAVEGDSEDAMWNNAKLVNRAVLLCMEFN